MQEVYGLDRGIDKNDLYRASEKLGMNMEVSIHDNTCNAWMMHATHPFRKRRKHSATRDAWIRKRRTTA